jgi:ankyrin repeat protein
MSTIPTNSHQPKELIDIPLPLVEEHKAMYNALYTGVSCNSIPLVTKVLANCGECLKWVHPDHPSFMDTAIKNNCLEMVQFLLSQGLTISLGQGDVHLNNALSNKNYDMVDVIVPHIKYVSGKTFIKLVRSGNAKWVDLAAPLIDLQEFTEGYRPIHWVCANGSVNMIKSLLKVGAKFGDNDHLSLRIALSRNDRVDVWELALEHTISKPFTQYRCTLNELIQGGNVAKILCLLQYALKHRDILAEIVATEFSRLMDLRNDSIFQAALKVVVHTNYQYGNPLLFAIRNNKLECFQWLIDTGFANWKDCMSEAVNYDRLEMVQRLLSMGCSPNEPGSYRNMSCIRCAGYNNNVEMVKCLLDAGASVDEFHTPMGFQGIHSVPIIRLILNRMDNPSSDNIKIKINQANSP